MHARGFSYVAAPDARVLIVGSMPGAASLQAQRYYANPRNQFWPIVLSWCQQPLELSYPERLQTLCKNRIALWDVLAECQRKGSLDADIDHTSIRCNDFAAFFAQQAEVKAVLFNGRTAQNIFQKRSYPTLSPAQQSIAQYVLPSTSPAHAGMSLEQKRQEWHQVLSAVLSF